MISVQIARLMQNIVRENTKGFIDPKRVYLYDVPEQLDILASLPIIKISHVTSNATTHSSNQLNYTKERFQLQLYFDDNDPKDYESMLLNLEYVLREKGFYYSTGYDSYDPDYDGVLTITRQYNYRNKLQ